jgi:hypothetical protein
VSVTIDWIAFVQVFVVALIGALLVVGFYAIAVRLLVRGGKVPVVAPAEFTDAIAIISEKERVKAAKAAAKAAKKSPLTDRQKLVARIGAYISFGLCGLAVLGGIVLIVVQ